MLAAEVLRKGLPLAIGGVGRVDDASAPIPTNLIYAQYPRLGATGAWIARSFLNEGPGPRDLQADIVKLRSRLNEWAAAPVEDLEHARAQLARHAASWRPTSSRSFNSVA
jgi:hypothetical protein